MPKPKGRQNKITTEVKEQLQHFIDEVVNRIDVDAMTTDQKLKCYSSHFTRDYLNFEVQK